ncbi:hypothetical protein ACFFF7_08965 [Novosphingobium aquiterrae]|uniref:Uncharacterized protein n=1 Tax=Novosphingobium aquiterrae TaxID=624388 RepID=A0ABV6PI87_9SPHN
MVALNADSDRDSATIRPGKGMSDARTRQLAANKRQASLQAQLNRLRKLEVKAGQRLIAHKRQFVTADWQRGYHEPGTTKAVYWAQKLSAALQGWQAAATELLSITGQISMLEITIAQSLAEPRPDCSVSPASRIVKGFT